MNEFLFTIINKQFRPNSVHYIGQFCAINLFSVHNLNAFGLEFHDLMFYVAFSLSGLK